MAPQTLFWLLFLLNLFNYIDRQVLYAVFPLLQTELHTTDFQLGVLASMFMLVYMCYAPVTGYLADRFNRPRLISISAFIWGLATFVSGCTKNFAQLLGARAAVGIGEGGFTTIAQPFLAEHYPNKKHAWILGLFGLALPLGSALGYMLGGIIGHTMGWRFAFMLVSVPGIFLALITYFLPDKARQSCSPKPGWEDYRLLLQNKSFLYVCLIQTSVTFLMGGLSAWAPTYFYRYLRLNTAQAGTWFGILVIVCGGIGTFLGGKWASGRLQKSARAYYEIMALGLLGCFIPLWIGLGVSQLPAALTFFGLTVICLFLPTGAIAAALVDTTPAATRAMAFAVNIFLIHLLGDALSPSFIGLLSQYWGLKVSLGCCSLIVLPGLFFCWKAAKQNENATH